MLVFVSLATAREGEPKLRGLTFVTLGAVPARAGARSTVAIQLVASRAGSVLVIGLWFYFA